MKLSIALLASGLLLSSCATARTGSFSTPENAVHELVAAADDPAAADRVLGAGGSELLSSGDEDADREDLRTVRALVQEGVTFEDAGHDRKIALLGHEGWPLPIPLVRAHGAWHFDVDAGRQEMRNRRVGCNELATITTVREIVEAQHEYCAEGCGGQAPAYACRVPSSDGQRDGLYWPVSDGDPESPLGPLVAEACVSGDGDSGPIPYHGYLYRLLLAQGSNAPGGERDYFDEQGLLTRGFGVIAWPATFDDSGVMTFVVNQQGIVFQKDLGSDTAAIAARIESYDPDASWTPAVD